MPRKKYIYLQLYVKDFTGDERLRWCSPAAWGVYSYLLCLLNSADTRGSLQMNQLEQKPHLKRSLTQRTLRATSDRTRLMYFAELLQRQMPWKRSEIFKSLCELARYKVILVQGDTLIQPRMYRESLRITRNESAKKAATHPAKPDTQNAEKTPEPAEQQTRKEKPSSNKPRKPKPQGLPFQDFWDAYDKKRDRPTSERLWSALKPADQQAIMDYLPSYKEAQPDKRFRKDPTTFLRHKSWEDEIIHNSTPNKQPKTILHQAEVDDKEDW